jgi:hypothetical protein
MTRRPVMQRFTLRAPIVWYIRLVLPRVLFWFAVHNWTELRREKLQSVGVDHDPIQADDCRDMRPSGHERWIRERTKMADMSAERCGEY